MISYIKIQTYQWITQLLSNIFYAVHFKGFYFIYFFENKLITKNKLLDEKIEECLGIQTPKGVI